MTTKANVPLLLALTRSGITSQPLPESQHARLTDEAWKELADLASAHDLLALIGAGAKVSGIRPPADTRAMLLRAARLAEIRADRAWEQMGGILDAWRELGIEAIALKGVLLATRHYRTPGLRPFGDLDLLVAPAQRDQAAQALIDLGYQCTDDLDAGGKAWCLENHFHWTFMRQGAFPVELHWSLTFTFPPTPADLSSVWERSVSVPTPAGNVRGFGPEDEVLSLAAHMTGHCFRLPLRCHADFAAILRQFTEEQWTCLWTRAMEMGQERDLSAILGVGRTLGLLDLPADISAQIDTDASLSLPFLANYAVESPFIIAPERMLDVKNAPTFQAKAGRLWRVLFPRYTHLWTRSGETQMEGRPLLIYAAAWSRRASRLLGHVRNLPKLAADFRRISRMHQMFGTRRRRSLPPAKDLTPKQG